MHLSVASRLLNVENIEQDSRRVLYVYYDKASIATLWSVHVTTCVRVSILSYIHIYIHMCVYTRILSVLIELYATRAVNVETIAYDIDLYRG